MRGLRLRLSLTGSAAAAGLPSFTNETETTTLVTALTAASSAPTTRRQKSMNWAIKTLKDAGVWTKILGLWKVGVDEPHSLVNWKTPGTFDLTKTGAPTFVSNIGYTGSTGNRLSTGINLTAITAATCYIGFFSNTSAASGASDVGAIDASGAGLTLNSRNTSNFAGGRVGGANVTNLDATGSWTGDGWTAAGRVDASNVTVYKGPVKKAVTANATATLGSAVITFLGANNNGSFGVSSRQQGGWVIAHGLTEADQKVLANVMNQLQREFRYGGLDTYEAGYAPTTATYDVVVYGATFGGCVEAIRNKRSGRTVAIVGGHRERGVGGTAAQGSLGYTDWDNLSALRGTPLYILNKIQAAMGTASTVTKFDPQVLENVLRGMLDPSRADGFDIPIFWSDGVVSCTKTGTRINTMTTADGRTFTATIGFIDATYELDLTAVAGCTTTVGREAAGTGLEAVNGFRGHVHGAQGDDPQFKTAAGALMNVDPWVIPGDTGSGLLPGILGVLGVDSPAAGAATSDVQAYNYRLLQSQDLGWRVPFPNTPPPGYSAATYEPLARQLALDPTLTLANLLKQDAVNAVSGSTFNDVNYRNGMSTDYLGGSTNYPLATYAQREVIRKAHENYIRGWFYFLQYEADARIPAALRTAALTFCLSMQHYTRPHPNDDYHWPPQIYVREARRLVGDYIINANDLGLGDGTTPRSTDTAAVASYTMDSHAYGMWAYELSPGVWVIWNEGGMGQVGGGADVTSPIPMQAMMPKASECTNLLVLFGLSATHIAFGSLRMEFTGALLGDFAGSIIDEAAANPGVAFQSLSYANIRTRALAGNTLPGETQLYLPQVN